MKIWIVYYFPQQSYNFFLQDQVGIEIVGIFKTRKKAYEYLSKLHSIQEIQEEMSEDNREEDLEHIYAIVEYDLDYQLYSDEELNQLKSKEGDEK